VENKIEDQTLVYYVSCPFKEYVLNLTINFDDLTYSLNDMTQDKCLCLRNTEKKDHVALKFILFNFFVQVV
jgi:hypothetical protein